MNENLGGGLILLFLTSIFFVIGYSIGVCDNKHQELIDSLIAECETDLPRSQSCTWEIIATKEAAK